METSFETRKGIVIQTLLCSLLSVLMTGHGTETDIFCLRSIKDSLEDPFGYLSSWNFDNKTESVICSFAGVDCWHPDENRVLSLKLSNMGLKGQFPRALQNCSSLIGLDLSFNQLTGTIPSDISTLVKFATNIDLSNNKFTGEIPGSLANCTYLNSLRLGHNMFRGQIPAQFALLQRIKLFDVSNNQLSGPVPSFYLPISAMYANNNGLCGGPLEPCSLDNRSTQFHQSFKNGLIVGYVFSVTFAIVLYMSYCAPWTPFKLTKNSHPTKAKQLAKYIPRRTTRIEANQTHQPLPLQLQQKGSKEVSVLMGRLTSTMSLEELSDATDCFSMENAIGMGKIGITYEGKLPNGRYLAVKRLFDSQQFKKQFLLETMILGKYKHRNIVPLLGFCIERKERILVYQYMSNGRLSKWLHPLQSEVFRLKWPERVKIALGIARALSWLHHTCNLRIVHFNISSECILLDENFEPKLSNFGEAKFMNPNMDDDLGMIFYVNDGKKDVYDFGSVLFELITGKTFEELSCSSNTGDLSLNPSNFYDAIDKSLIWEGFANEIYALIKVACECVRPFPDQRPTMLQVYNNIGNTLERRNGDFDTPRGSEIVSATSIYEIVEL